MDFLVPPGVGRRRRPTSYRSVSGFQKKISAVGTLLQLPAADIFVAICLPCCTLSAGIRKKISPPNSRDITGHPAGTKERGFSVVQSLCLPRPRGRVFLFPDELQECIWFPQKKYLLSERFRSFRRQIFLLRFVKKMGLFCGLFMVCFDCHNWCKSVTIIEISTVFEEVDLCV